jgi:hypothetical protein
MPDGDFFVTSTLIEIRNVDIAIWVGHDTYRKYKLIVIGASQAKLA